MTIHLTWWWLWWPLIGIWAGVALGLLAMSMIGSAEWYERPLMIIWPVSGLFLLLRAAILFLLGKD